MTKSGQQRISPSSRRRGCGFPDVAAAVSDFHLLHGGYLTAINDLAQYGGILPSTFATYSDWIRGDVQKRGKQETYLREVLSGIVKRYASRSSAAVA